ncbi:uncharacterized MFS-type transporter C09D4.1-like [Diabrotica virgifera virgifera]|uniref:Feline leukemia virus subgroup C receptor-related protein 2-like n=1 Tax=Diabrotica virgifera virgifera TaxID=50390 RepID=A0ABM5KQX7_DIAVI|nr:uncharacterized MFS-type transporter C09D4.1-like [Diabrotica virgifera virgifera]
MAMEKREESQGPLIEEGDSPKLRTYKRRWFILLMYMIYNALGSFQWICYSSITNLVVEYYGVNSILVDWTSIAYNAIYPLLVVPASYIIDKQGLRAAGVLGCCLTFLGTSLKLFSFHRDRFYVVVIGQIILAISNVLVACLPSKLAAVWFSTKEVTIACSLGVFGSQIGVALGYIFPSVIVNNHDSPETIGEGLRNLTWLLVLIAAPVTTGVLCYFPNEPPVPPSIVQAKIRDSKEDFQNKVFFNSLKDLFLNKPFVILMVAYGINIGVYSAVSTLLNQFILQYFEDADTDVGRMGCCMVLAGLCGAIGFSIVLDKTLKFKAITIVIYMFSIISVVFFMYALESRIKWLTYLSCASVGLFTTAFMPVGFEFAMEMTYPAEESTTSGILMAMTQILGVVFTISLGVLNKNLGCFWALASQAFLLSIGALVHLFVPSNVLLRQDALNQINYGSKRLEHHRSSRLVYIQ